MTTLRNRRLPFRDLLQQLEVEHEHELATLRNERDAARAEVKKLRASCSQGATSKLDDASCAGASSFHLEVMRERSGIGCVGGGELGGTDENMTSVSSGGSGGGLMVEKVVSMASSSEAIKVKITTVRTNNTSFEAFGPRPQWCANASRSAKLHRYSTMETFFDGDGLLRYQSSSLGDATCASRCTSRLISYPSSRNRLVWDSIGSVLIAIDMIMIPLGVFDPPESIIIDFFSWCALFFWTADVLASFFVGYVDKGLTEMNPIKIARHYLKTWFVVDIIAVAPDWIHLILDWGSGDIQSGEAEDAVKLIRVFRVARTIRLVRLLKLKRLISDIQDRIDSEYVSIIFTMAKLIIFLLLVNHFIACSWFLIGDASRNTSGLSNWIDAHDFSHKPWDYQYATSLHWALTQFTPASMHIQPQNLSERTFAISILIFALIVFSSLVGSITSSMNQLHSLQEDNTKEFWLLRRYLRQRGVPKVLAIRIQKYLEYACSGCRERVPEAQVKVLPLLSENLRAELACAFSVPHLSVHPLFEHMSKVSHGMMRRLCSRAVVQKMLARDDALFFPDETATHMFFLVAGDMQYAKASNSVGPMVAVQAKDWICEPVLWTSWVHLGEAQAATECDLISICAETFCEVICSTRTGLALVTDYAHKYIAWLNTVTRSGLTDISQLEDSRQTVASLVDGYVCEDKPLKANSSSSDRSDKSMKSVVTAVMSRVSSATRVLS